MDRSSRFQGCLLGLAIGDALGMPFEFMSPERIDWLLQGSFDFQAAPEGCVSGPLRAGQWTDDTQMALCITQSLLERGAVDGADIAARFRDWYRGGDLRGIGTTTGWALERLERGVPWNRAGRAGEGAAGNGPAMRVAPVGLWHARDASGLIEDVETATRITHDNSEAVRGAAAVAFAVARAAAGTLDPRTIVDETCDFIGPCLCAQQLRKAQALHDEGADWRRALAQLGTGGHVVETAGAAFFCLLLGDYAKGVEAAVRSGGDTDTTAAVAGALLGAQAGLPGIPQHWTERVEDGPRIAELARRLCGHVYGQERRS